MSFLQLRVVVWKNLIIRKRHWLLTIIESILPILLFILLDYAWHEIGGRGYSEINTDASTSTEVLNYQEDVPWIPNLNLLFAPDTEFNKDLMKRVQVKQVKTLPLNDSVKGFPSSESLLEYYESHKTSGGAIAVIFNGNQKNLDYTIRFPDTYYKSELYRTPFEYYPGLGIPYFYGRFVSIQKALDMSFIEKVSGKEMESQIKIVTQEFPYPRKQTDEFFIIFSILLPAITLFSFIFLCAAVLKRVVEEKYLGTKELLKMVGMKSWMLWLGWFIHGMIPILCSLVCIVVIMKVSVCNNNYPLIQQTDGSILFVFLLFYCMAAIVFCFAFSSLFNRPTLAMMCGILVWILSYFVPTYGLGLDNVGYKFSWIINILLNLLPNMTLHYGFLAISLYEQRGLGLQWNNFYKPATGGTEDVTMLNVFVMLIIDMIIYMSFTIYMDGVNPGKYGVRKSFLFPIYSLIKLIKKPGSVDYQGTEPLYLDHVEEGRGLSKGIEIQDVVKRYGHKDAVNNLTLNVYRNQITVLLGHNGAGKSTTMSMITGMIDVTAGTIKINGKDISTDMDEIRKSLGLCPQHNLLFTDLTVAEHLLFFAKLKGKSNEEAEKEMLELLKVLHLSEKKNSLASTLSGGMKRKLCLGMAIIGGSQVLILDEPTSGMDPESRRELWDLLLKWRGEKTILITTHFMEEADALGDWIAIMANGRLQCHGTPMYLKKEYDTGYHLSLIVSDNATENERNAIKNNIIKQIDLAELKDSNGNNMIFLLPLEENSQIANLLTFLEDNKERLKIENISVTVTTLEDVFLKVKLRNVIDAYDVSGLEIQDKSSINSPLKLFFVRILALIVKKLQFYRRKFWTYLIVTIIALLLFIVTVYFTSHSPSFEKSSKKLPMQLSIYRHTTAFYNGTDKNGIISKLKRNYKSLVENNDGEAFEVENVEKAIINKGIENIIFYNQHLIVSASFESGETIIANALYSGMAYHSAPISLNLITNSLVKTYLGSNYSISISNWPLKMITTESYGELSQITIILLWTILVPIAFVLVIGIFIVFPHIELSTSFIQLQYMCGVKPIFYWLINYLTDFLLLLIMSLVMVTTAVLMTSYIGTEEYFVLLLLFIIYGAANIPFAYLFSRKKSASGGYAAFVILNILFGIILTVILVITEAIQLSNKTEKIRQTLIILFMLILPQVGLVKSLQEFFMMATNKDKNDGYPFCVAHNSYAGTNKDCHNYLLQLQENMILMFLSGVIYLTLNILLDGYYVKKCTSIILHQISKLWYRYVMHYDDSVSPYQRLDEFESEENCMSLIAKNLQKAYCGRLVVKNISFTLTERECLGILGVNGAGKTTTFRMLTRDEIADSGYLEIIRRNKKSIPISHDEYLENLGYCPQIDALNFVLTGRQILTLMAKLRGLDDTEIVNKFLKLFELDQYADIPCGHYSGGNKRKLSLAVALIGYPKFVLLDEPTNGVDPSSRRKFWNLIRSFKENKDLSFILTSHSMVECEALCNNLKIMKDGRFEREGTISELKKEHGGFNIKLKLVNKNQQNNLMTEEGSNKGRQSGGGYDEPDAAVMMNDTFDNVEELIAYFKDKYNGTIKDEHSGLVHFYVDDKSKKWSSLFREVERIKMRNQHLIEDYSISEASLEDIFLTVARSKTAAEEEAPKKGGVICCRRKNM